MGVEVRELPNIDRPVVSVRADYPGAAPETLDAEVTRVLEGAASRVPGVDWCARPARRATCASS
jgi:hydrophobic/amphiphilic exporter-1 (mainly G- bacteria), HAE1 family